MKPEDRRPRILISGTSAYVNAVRMWRKLDQLFFALKDPIVCTRSWWRHERKAKNDRLTAPLGAEFYAEEWASNNKYLTKLFHPHDQGGREAADKELMVYCTARRPCFAFFYGVDESCRGLLKLCKKNDFVVRTVEADR